MKITLAIALGMLAGCAQIQQAQFNKDADACKAEIPAVVGNLVRREQCVVDAANRAGLTGPSMGLLNAKRMELAEKADKGEITAAQASAEYAQVRYQVAQDDAAQRVARAHAFAALMMSMPQPQPVSMPIYQIQQPVRLQTTCMRMGNMVSCN